MAKRKLHDHLVAISPALPLSQDVAVRDELRKNPMRSALGDADSSCDVTESRPGVMGDANENVSVIGEEIPLRGRLAWRILISRRLIHESVASISSDARARMRSPTL
jgi:hypothetical protein